MGRASVPPRLLLDEKPLKVIRFLGEGAFAEVFLAEKENQNLAVKVLKPGQSAFIEPFRQEFLLGKTLGHPSFVRFFRFGWTDAKIPFYTMEFLQGTELKKLWPKLDRVSKKLLCYQLFLGLTLLHKKELVHRDLKPSNLMVIPRPKAGPPFQLKIMDLGLARSSHPPEGESVGGTVDYLAPELIRKEKSDFRADFYACGIILCELFLGRPPFADSDPAATLARHQEAPLPKLPIRSQKEKAFWQNLINRLAAKNKEERPQEGAEVLNLLLEDPALKKTLAKQDESAADWCRTLLPRPWSLPSHRLENELSAEVPETVRRAKEELTDQSDLEKKTALPNVRLAIEPEHSLRAYPRFSATELESWLASNFNGTKEVAKILWQKTSGEVSLLELELAFWQQKKLLSWNQTSWEISDDHIRDARLSPASEKELLALAATLPEEERQLLTRLSLFLDSFKLEEIAKTRIWEKENLGLLLKNLLASGFLVSLDEIRYAFSRSGLRETLYHTVKNRKENHRRISDCFAQSGQISDKTRSREWEFQAAGAEAWEEAARQALVAAEQADAGEDFKTELWYLDRSLQWIQKTPARTRRDALLLDIYRARGNFFGRQGELERAIVEYSLQLKLAKKLKNLQEEADAYNRLGNHLRQKADYLKAEKTLKKALALFQKLGDELNLSYVHNNLGAAYAHQLRFEESLTHYTKAAEIQRRLGATKNLALTLNNIGVAQMMADHLQEGTRFFREALELNRKLDEKEQIALCLNNLGFTQAQRGEFREAEKLLLEALELNRQIGSQKWEVLNLETLAMLAYRTGNYPGAIRYALLGLELSEKINYRGNHLSLLASLGGSLKAQGQYAEAEKYLSRGLALAGEIHDQSSEVLLHLEMTELALLVNDLLGAERTAGLAAEKIKGVSDAALRARLFILLGKIASRKREIPEAEKNFDEAEKLLVESEHYPERRMLALVQAEWLGLDGRGKKIEDLLAGVRTLSGEPPDRSQTCEKLFLEARASWKNGNLESARRQASEALELAYRLSEPEKIWRLHHFMAKLWMEEKNYQKVFGELQSAAQMLESLRGNFDSEESLNRYFQDPEKVNLLTEIQKMAEFLGR